MDILSNVTVRTGGTFSVVRSQAGPTTDVRVGGVVQIVRSRESIDTYAWVGGVVQVMRGRPEDQILRSAIGAHFGGRNSSAVTGIAQANQGSQSPLGNTFGPQLPAPATAGAQQWQ